MKYVCTVCERMSSDGNLWCQEKYCPGGDLNVVLNYGETLGDLHVERLLRVLPTAAIYEARRGETPLLLKIAHSGCQEQLKREATVLAGAEHPMLPALVAPYPGTDVRQRPYGKTVIRDEVKYYEVFAFSESQSLRDFLNNTPQPFYMHAAWLTTSIADAVAYLHVKFKKMHLNLSPDSIFVRVDRDGIPRPLLLDLGAVGEPEQVDLSWLLRYGQPAYLAPELLDRSGAPTFASDVYGLGLLFYEMLAGKPAFGALTRRPTDIRAQVVEQPVAALERSDLADDVVQAVMSAVDRNPTRRPPDVRTFAKVLRGKFGEVPAERKGSGIQRRLLIGAVAAVLLIVVLLLLAAVFGG